MISVSFPSHFFWLLIINDCFSFQPYCLLTWQSVAKTLIHFHFFPYFRHTRKSLAVQASMAHLVMYTMLCQEKMVMPTLFRCLRRRRKFLTAMVHKVKTKKWVLQKVKSKNSFTMMGKYFGNNLMPWDTFLLKWSGLVRTALHGTSSIKCLVMPRKSQEMCQTLDILSKNFSFFLSFFPYSDDILLFFFEITVFQPKLNIPTAS